MDYKKLIKILNEKTFLFFSIFLGYVVFNGFLNKTYIIFDKLYSSFSFVFSTFFIFVNFVFIPTLVSLTLILTFDKIRDLKYLVRGKGFFSFLGIFGTFLGGACPSCFVGIFPAFVGLFGSSLTLRNLPFYGLEIQLFSSLILIISLHYLTRKTVCLMK